MDTILGRVGKEEIEDSVGLAKELGMEHQALVGQLLKLELEQYVKLEVVESKRWAYTQEGKSYAENGTPEFKVYQAVPAEGIKREDLQKLVEGNTFKIGFQNAMSKKLIQVDKGVVRKAEGEVTDEDRNLLVEAVAGQNAAKDVVDRLKKRKLIVQEVSKSFRVSKGAKYQPAFKKRLADITPEMLKDGSWQTESFKEMNYDARGKPLNTGGMHPLLKVRKQFAQILISMGFEEMPTNQFVESSFWNFDALFQPQQHPARDAHDTFFVRDPELSQQGDDDLWQRVKNMHEQGGAGSIGYNYSWSRDEARKNIFRTHTTAVSSKMLHRLAQHYRTHGYAPKKYFSIDRVFRNETLDATHLAEFHQIEGIVIDKNANLGTLMGVIREFFKKIGITKLWFKPTYNPYTEPSMEIYGNPPSPTIPIPRLAPSAQQEGRNRQQRSLQARNAHPPRNA